MDVNTLTGKGQQAFLFSDFRCSKRGDPKIPIRANFSFAKWDVKSCFTVLNVPRLNGVICRF